MPATTHITWNQNDVFLTTGCLVGKWPQICDPQDADAIGINKGQNNSRRMAGQGFHHHATTTTVHLLFPDGALNIILN